MSTTMYIELYGPSEEKGGNRTKNRNTQFSVPVAFTFWWMELHMYFVWLSYMYMWLFQIKAYNKNSFVTTSFDQTIKLWKVDDGKDICHFRGRYLWLLCYGSIGGSQMPILETSNAMVGCILPFFSDVFFLVLFGCISYDIASNKSCKYVCSSAFI